MKCKYNLLFAFLLLLGCEKAATDLHNGEYVFTDKTEKHVVHESIIINGNTATLHMRSLFNRSKLSKRTYLCLHYPDRIDLQLRKQPPISIPVDEEGDLLWGEKRFQKQIPLIIQPIPIPKALLEAME